MKKILSSLSIITLFLLTSCTTEPLDSSLKSENETTSSNPNGGNTGGGTTPTYYLKTKIDGVQKIWTGADAIAVFLNSSMFSITCANTTPNEEFLLVINNAMNGPVTAINYPFDWARVVGSYDFNNDTFVTDYSNFETSPGGINITEINTANKTIKGNFSFVGKNATMSIAKSFSEGEFFLQYIIN
jgi:hypothetical protein